MYRNPHNEYSHINDKETYAERQSRIKAQAKKDEEAAERIKAQRLAFEERMAKRIVQAKADFDALGELMEKTTDRKESIELARKREDLAPHTGRTFSYENHCWKCKSHISSAIHARCKDCSWYICSSCGSCSPDCGITYNPFYVEDVDPFLDLYKT